VDRREAIKTALRLTGVAYVAPMVLGSVTPVAARQGSPTACTGSVCPNFADCTPVNQPQGGADLSCTCFTLATGGGFCAFDPGVCDLNPCGAGNSCPAGSVCIVGTCCSPNPNRCIPLAFDCALVSQTGNAQAIRESLRSGRGGGGGVYQH
jgi:hypothetical protein